MNGHNHIMETQAGEILALRARVAELESLLAGESSEAFTVLNVEAFGVRSGKWPAVRRRYLADHPACAACGTEDYLTVHHRRPFHLHPELELEEANLLTLCETPGRNCHFRLGHAFDWRAYVPSVAGDAVLSFARITGRQYT